jgi:hypothetical protein
MASSTGGMIVIKIICNRGHEIELDELHQFDEQHSSQACQRGRSLSLGTSTPFCFHLRNTSFVAEFRSSAMALVQPALKKDDDIDDDCECFLPCQMT